MGPVVVVRYSIPEGISIHLSRAHQQLSDHTRKSSPLIHVVTSSKRYSQAHDVKSQGLATSPDDKFLWAAGSDSRLRLYSTSSGQRIMPYPPSSSLSTSAESTMSGGRGTMGGDDQLFGRQIGPKEGNPLRRVFKGKVEHISVRPDDLGLDISVKGEIMRFSRMGQGRHQHRHQDPGGQGDEDQSESEISEESMDLDRAGGIRYELDDLD